MVMENGSSGKEGFPAGVEGPFGSADIEAVVKATPKRRGTIREEP
jgi:hypothetical protein